MLSPPNLLDFALAIKKRRTMLRCSCQPGAAMPHTRVANAPSKVKTLEFTQIDQSRAILIIRNGLVNHQSIADPEINLSACLCELEMLGM